jgi:low temperature requirement protein LtrA
MSSDDGRVDRMSEAAPAGNTVRGEVENTLRGEEDSRQANFLELFFDLMLVFALIGVVSRVVPDLLAERATERWLALSYMIVLALPFLWLWTTTTYITSRFDPRHHRVQLMVLVSAFGQVIMSTSLPYAFVGRGLAFAAPYVLLQIVRPLLLLPLVRQREELRSLYARTAVWSAVSAVFWLCGVLVQEESRVILWLIAITVDLVAARLRWPVPGFRQWPSSAWAMASSTHLPERYQQLLLIALGETVLAAGITYTNEPVTLAKTAALVVAFLTTVLLWRIYFYRSGQVLAEAVAASTNRPVIGGRVGVAHILMVLGIVAVAAGSEIVQKHPGGHPPPPWLAMILGGPVLFLIGRIKLERAVFNRLSPRRVVGVVTLLLLALPLAVSPSLIATGAASVVLLGIAIADARHAAGRPPEAPSPPA